MRIFSRTDRSIFANWWWTVDRSMVLGVLVLILFGYFMAFAASPAVAQHIGKPTYYFANKQLVFLTLAFVVFLVVSLLDAIQIRTLAILLLIGSIGAVIATLVIGVEAKGSMRWLRIAGLSLQPSEILKPAFVVVMAWLFSRQRAQFDSKALWLACALLGLVSFLLSMQPDIGQMTLIFLVWMCLYFLSGGSMRLLVALTLIGTVLGGYVYATKPHVASRVDRFIDPSSGDTYQVDNAMEAIRSGGFVGVGLGDGQVKSILPDAHSDYVFAVAAEEGGLLMGCLIVGLFGFLVLRALSNLRDEKEHWIQLAASGLICLFGLQATINLAVNLNLMPSKGMTLPFISYGGSSLLASAITMGMLVGLMRRRTASAARVDVAGTPIIRILGKSFGGRI
jgi:cell division protein FtsW